MKAENDRVAEKYYLDLLDISVEVGEKEDNQLFHWVRPIHLDDEVGNPDTRIATHAREFGVNVECVLSEEVHSESFSKDTDDSLHATLHSHQEIDSTSAGHSSKPSAAGTSASGYDGSRGGTDDRVDNGEEILMNVDIVNIQLANLLVKMILHTAHKMKTMTLEELVQA